MSSSDKIAAMAAVMRKDRCACGRPKRVRVAFCNSCGRALGDESIRHERYKLSGCVNEVMIAAYIACGKWLYEQGYCTREVSL